MRKNLCKPLSAAEAEATDADVACEKCGKVFSSAKTLGHHLRTVCRHKSATAQNDVALLQQELAEMKCALSELKRQETVHSTVVNNNSTTINGDVDNSVNFNINVVVPWIPGKTVTLNDGDFVEAFGEHVPSEWLQQTVQEQTDGELGPPFVTASLVALIRQGHKNPECQNIHLNPRRADQAMVFGPDGLWKCVTKNEAIRILLNDVAKRANDIGLLKVQSSLDMKMKETLAAMYMMYGDDPEGYVKRANSSMDAHLQNLNVLWRNREARLQIAGPPEAQ
jgi:hypothetical protein